MAFTRSVGPACQSAIIAWSELGGLATPPGLPVMIAAMLRRPTLEVVLDAIAACDNKQLQLFASKPGVRFSPCERERLARGRGADVVHSMMNGGHSHANWRGINNSLLALSASGDIEQLLEDISIILLKDTEEGPKLTDDGRARVAVVGGGRDQSTHILYPALAVQVTLLWQDLSGSGLRAVESMSHVVSTARTSSYFRVITLDKSGILPNLAAPDAVRRVAVELLNDHQQMSYPRAPPARSTASARCEGDCRALLTTLPQLPTPQHYAALVGMMSNLDAPTVDLVTALDNLDAADVAAALLAIRDPHDTSRQPRIVADAWLRLRYFEQRRRFVRHSQGSLDRDFGYQSAPISSTREVLLPAWKRDDGAPILTALGRSTLGPDALVMLAGGASPATLSRGTPATADRSTFLSRWSELTRGVLDGWDWGGTIAAGGAVAWCLDAESTDPRQSRPSDVDLFFHGLTLAGVAVQCGRLEKHAREKAGGSHAGYMTLLTSRTMTIVFADPELPRLQVALGFWEEPADVLQTADVDCCCVGFDGSEVVMTARGAMAWARRVNTVHATLNTVRGSPTYEMRLWKYATRHGFGVFDPVNVASHPWVVGERAAAAKAAGGLAGLAGQKGARATARRHATSTDGLRWLLLVEAGVITPTEPRDELRFTDAASFRALRDKVSSAGFMASDNYGQHEEGYVVLTDSEDPPDMPTTHKEVLERYSLSPEHMESMYSNALYEGSLMRKQLCSEMCIQNLDGVEDIRQVTASWKVGEAAQVDDDDR